MGYTSALKAAGIDVLLFKHFGSYQGDWWAKVVVGNETGWIHGSFGSCSECDAFQAEVGYEPFSSKDDPDLTEEERREWEDYDARLKQFGESYISSFVTKEEAIKIASVNLDWDHEAEGMVNFIKNN